MDDKKFRDNFSDFYKLGIKKFVEISAEHNRNISILIEKIDKSFLSIKDAEKNCNKNNNTLLDECSILTIHGILHLLGYDHDTKKKEQSMFDLQEKIYKKVI